MTKFRVFFILALVLLSSPFFLQVARCQSDSYLDGDADLVAETVEEGGYIGVVGDDVQNFRGGSFTPAPGVATVCVFLKNPSKLVVAGEETELLIGMKNEGEQSVKVLAVHASIHLPFDHRMLVQNLSAEPGTFDLVGTIVYEVDQLPYRNIFYNDTIEVIEAGGLVSVETVFLITLGIALHILFILWVRGQIQDHSKKTKRVRKVEIGTRTVHASMDEWLQGTAYTRWQSNKMKKKK